MADNIVPFGPAGGGPPGVPPGLPPVMIQAYAPVKAAFEAGKQWRQAGFSKVEIRQSPKCLPLAMEIHKAGLVLALPAAEAASRALVRALDDPLTTDCALPVLSLLIDGFGRRATDNTIDYLTALGLALEDDEQILLKEDETTPLRMSPSVLVCGVRRVFKTAHFPPSPGELRDEMVQTWHRVQDIGLKLDDCIRLGHATCEVLCAFAPDNETVEAVTAIEDRLWRCTACGRMWIERFGCRDRGMCDFQPQPLEVPWTPEELAAFEESGEVPF